MSRPSLHFEPPPPHDRTSVLRRWKTLLVVTSPFHQLRSELVFRKLVSELAAKGAAVGRAEAGEMTAGRKEGSGAMKVYMARTAMFPHAGYFSPFANQLIDLWDWARELLALAYYFMKGRL
ncbi:hypothetical protein Vretifemale_5554 [Volvox reticuliferus]|uniref:DUF218 domain-containing protein n=1 Tax=Volvox reticuliferus TaxID=1737510 RepID=A0A8J4FLN6_9CHLO|nr:hypothetical protein Vretifemale_5554 [Volvox reticuliferus]